MCLPAAAIEFSILAVKDFKRIKWTAFIESLSLGRGTNLTKMH